MKASELSKVLSDCGQAPISCSIEIPTGSTGSDGEEIVSVIHGYDIVDAITVRNSPNSEPTEVVLQFESAGSRVQEVCPIEAVTELAKIKHERDRLLETLQGIRRCGSSAGLSMLKQANTALAELGYEHNPRLVKKEK